MATTDFPSHSSACFCAAATATASPGSTRIFISFRISEIADIAFRSETANPLAKSYRLIGNVSAPGNCVAMESTACFIAYQLTHIAQENKCEGWLNSRLASMSFAAGKLTVSANSNIALRFERVNSRRRHKPGTSAEAEPNRKSHSSIDSYLFGTSRQQLSQTWRQTDVTKKASFVLQRIPGPLILKTK